MENVVHVSIRDHELNWVNWRKTMCIWMFASILPCVSVANTIGSTNKVFLSDRTVLPRKCKEKKENVNDSAQNTPAQLIFKQGFMFITENEIHVWTLDNGIQHQHMWAFLIFSLSLGRSLARSLSPLYVFKLCQHVENYFEKFSYGFPQMSIEPQRCLLFSLSVNFEHTAAAFNATTPCLHSVHFKSDYILLLHMRH